MFKSFSFCRLPAEDQCIKTPMTLCFIFLTSSTCREIESPLTEIIFTFHLAYLMLVILFINSCEHVDLNSYFYAIRSDLCAQRNDENKFLKVVAAFFSSFILFSPVLFIYCSIKTLQLIIIILSEIKKLVRAFPLIFAPEKNNRRSEI